MKNKFIRLISILTVSAILLIGCGTGAPSDDNIESDKITIVTSFYPIYISTLNIVKDIPNVELVNMTKAQTGCLHDYQLSPEDLKTLQKADAFVINGGGMEEFLDKVVSQQKNLPIIDSSTGVNFLYGEDHHNHEGEEEHEHETEATDEHTDNHDHDHEGEVTNPHVWVSISNNIKQVENIANQLSLVDPDNKEKYMSNANDYILELKSLRDEMHETIDTLPTKDIITFHESFPYFAKEFHLNIAGVIEIEPGTEPTPKQMEEIIELIKTSGIKAIFAEPQYASKTAETIARESGATVYTLDPIVTGDSNKDAYDDYLNKMKENLEVLKEALK